MPTPDREALEQIAGMDPEGIRADDLGRAARIARAALSCHPTATAANDVMRLANAYAAACVEFEKASVADAVERELRAEMLGAEKKLHATIAALSAPVPQVLPAGFVIFDVLSGCKAGQLIEDLPLGTQLYARAALQGATAPSTEGAAG